MLYQWKSVLGCALLRRYLEAVQSPTQRALAERLGTKEQTVCSWKSGFRRPGHEYREALRKIAKIPLDSWLTPSERLKLRKLRAA